MSKTKFRWIYKLIMSKNYVIITDKEAVINVRAMSPDKFNDVMGAAIQQQQLVTFREKLDSVIKKYERAISRQLGHVPSKPKKSGKKIKVTEG